MRTRNLWATLSVQPFPNLHELTSEERDHFMLLDTSLRNCLEEWFASDGQLTPCSILQFDDCTRSTTRRFRLLDGEGWYYFGQSRRLVRRILHALM